MVKEISTSQERALKEIQNRIRGREVSCKILVKEKIKNPLFCFAILLETPEESNSNYSSSLSESYTSSRHSDLISVTGSRSSSRESRGRSGGVDKSRNSRADKSGQAFFREVPKVPVSKKGKMTAGVPTKGAKLVTNKQGNKSMYQLVGEISINRFC